MKRILDPDEIQRVVELARELGVTPYEMYRQSNAEFKKRPKPVTDADLNALLYKDDRGRVWWKYRKHGDNAEWFNRKYAGTQAGDSRGCISVNGRRLAVSHVLARLKPPEATG
jgi:hypothetical protein